MIALYYLSHGDQVKVLRFLKGPDFLKNFLLNAKNLARKKRTQSKTS